MSLCSHQARCACHCAVTRPGACSLLLSPSHARVFTNIVSTACKLQTWRRVKGGLYGSDRLEAGDSGRAIYSGASRHGASTEAGTEQAGTEQAGTEQAGTED